VIGGDPHWSPAWHTPASVMLDYSHDNDEQKVWV